VSAAQWRQAYLPEENVPQKPSPKVGFELAEKS